MLIRDWKGAGYHKVATILTSELPGFFEKLVRHSKSADSCCQQSGVLLTLTSRFQPVNFGFHHCFAEDQVAITWLGEASDNLSNPAGRGFLCRMTQDLRDRDRLLESEQPILRFEYSCRTCHLDDPSVSFPLQVTSALSLLERQVLRKRKRRGSSRSTSTNHSNPPDNANGQMESPLSNDMYQHNKSQDTTEAVDTDIPDGQVVPRKQTYHRSATKGGTTMQESQSPPPQPNDITGENALFMADGQDSGRADGKEDEPHARQVAVGKKADNQRKGDEEEEPKGEGESATSLCEVKLVVNDSSTCQHLHGW